MPGAGGNMVCGQYGAIVDQEPGTDKGGTVNVIADEYVSDAHR
jgi:hypothetical protein